MAKTKSNDKNSELKEKRLRNLKPFKKGQSGNPKGRRKGQRDYRTLFWLAIERIAENKGLEPEEVEEALHIKAIEKAGKGDFFFYQELNNRVHGKVTDKMDVTSGGKSLADLILAANNVKRGAKR
jgi:hypothetical protein